MGKNNRFGQAAILSAKENSRIRAKLSNKQKLIFDIARFTGERWGAIVQLQVSDVFDRDGNPLDYITFKAHTRKAAPSGKQLTRQVPMHPMLRELLRSHEIPSSGWLFPNRLDPKKHITRRGAAYGLGVGVTKAGLKEKGISTHSTRRTLITRLSENGVDLKTIQSITGHQDVRTLLKYVEQSPDRIKAAIALLE